MTQTCFMALALALTPALLTAMTVTAGHNMSKTHIVVKPATDTSTCANEPPHQLQPPLPYDTSQATIVDSLNEALELCSSRDSSSGRDVTIHLLPGRHTVSSTVMHDGSLLSVSQSIKFQGHACSNTGQGPFVSGGVAIKGWKQDAEDKNIWTATLPNTTMPFTDVYVNLTKPLLRARTPNLGNYYVWKSPLCGDFKKKASPCSQWARYGFVYDGKDVDPSWTSEPDPQFVVYHGWTASRHHLKSVFEDNSTVLFYNPSDRPIGWWPNHDSEGGGRYFVENIRSALDQPGEWYHDAAHSQLLLYLDDGQDPNNMEVVIPQLDQLLYFNNTRQISINGISFGHVNFICSAEMVCDRQSTDWQRTAMVTMENTVDSSITECELAGAGAYAVWIRPGCQNVTVARNAIHDLGSGAVRVGDDASYTSGGVPRLISVTDNIMTRGGLAFPSGTPVLVQKAANVTVSHNDISFFCYTGISIGWSWTYADPSGTDNITVSYNHVHNLGSGTFRQLGDAMAAIYTLGVLNGTVVHHNLLHDVYAWNRGGYCLSQDQGSSNTVFTNNICHRTTGASQTQHYGLHNKYVNNIFSSGYTESWTTDNSPGIRSVPQDTDPDQFTFTNNIVYVRNSSGPLFKGYYIDTGNHSFSFSSNLYWSTVDPDIANKSIWGGCTQGGGACKEGQLTFQQWTHGCGTSDSSSKSNCTGPHQDANSVVADPMFANPDGLNFTIPEDSPAYKIGFKPIDMSNVGPRPSSYP